MNGFIYQLRAHTGGLIRLKTDLYWYGGQIGWDKNPGRVCLILDAATTRPIALAATTRPIAPVARAGRNAARAGRNAAAGALANAGIRTAYTLLLIDGSPQWIWLADSDVELL